MTKTKFHFSKKTNNQNKICCQNEHWWRVTALKPVRLMLFSVFTQLIKRNINNVRRMTSHPTLPYCKSPARLHAVGSAPLLMLFCVNGSELMTNVPETKTC